MKLRVLGCSGGIGGRGGTRMHTTSFLIDDDILIDAGTGVEDLSVEQLARIDHIFLSHSHLDHICALPLMIDTVGAMRAKPLVVHALRETIDALKQHIFNWVIWPDFTEIPHYERPWMVFEAIDLQTPTVLGDRSIRAIAANHTVPAVGYHIRVPTGSLIYSGDTSTNPEFWRTVNRVADLKYLILENAFSNKEQDLAITSKHMYPIRLAEELTHFRSKAKLLITHLKPSDHDQIVREVEAWAGKFRPQVLEAGFELEI